MWNCKGCPGCWAHCASGEQPVAYFAASQPKASPEPGSERRVKRLSLPLLLRNVLRVSSITVAVLQSRNGLEGREDVHGAPMFCSLRVMGSGFPG